MWKDLVKSLISEEPESVPLETQLQALAELGIAPRDEAARESLTTGFTEEEFAEDPYHLLLTVLGGCREAEDGTLIPNSDDVFFFDVHCGQEPGVYADVIGQLCELSGGVLDVTGITEEPEPEKAKLRVSCTAVGAERVWELEMDGDLFDIDLFTHLSDILPADGKSFFIHVGDDTVTVFFSDAKTAKQLNRVSGMGFYRA